MYRLICTSGRQHCWSATNVHQFMESPFHPQKIGVFCAMSREKIVGPFFFTTTINGDRYEHLMLDFISQLSWNERKCFFQQDGATARTKSATIHFFGPFFRKHLIGLNSVSGIEWSLRSPDLPPSDFFCGHTLKIESTRLLHRIFPI